MEAVFRGAARLLPSKRDLSFYNHQTQELAYNASPSFEVHHLTGLGATGLSQSSPKG